MRDVKFYFAAFFVTFSCKTTSRSDLLQNPKKASYGDSAKVSYSCKANGSELVPASTSSNRLKQWNFQTINPINNTMESIRLWYETTEMTDDGEKAFKSGVFRLTKFKDDHWQHGHLDGPSSPHRVVASIFQNGDNKYMKVTHNEKTMTLIGDYPCFVHPSIDTDNNPYERVRGVRNDLSASRSVLEGLWELQGDFEGQKERIIFGSVRADRAILYIQKPPDSAATVRNTAMKKNKLISSGPLGFAQALSLALQVGDQVLGETESFVVNHSLLPPRENSKAVEFCRGLSTGGTMTHMILDAIIEDVAFIDLFFGEEDKMTIHACFSLYIPKKRSSKPLLSLNFWNPNNPTQVDRATYLKVNNSQMFSKGLLKTLLGK